MNRLALDTSNMTGSPPTAAVAVDAANAVDVPVYDSSTFTRTRPDPRRGSDRRGRRHSRPLGRRIPALMNLKVFVDTDPDVRLIRRLSRDVAERDRNSPSYRCQRGLGGTKDIAKSES